MWFKRGAKESFKVCGILVLYDGWYDAKSVQKRG